MQNRADSSLPDERPHLQSTAPVDEERRSIAKLLLGAVGASVGVTAIGCGADDASALPTNAELGRKYQALDNIPLDACDTMSDLRNVVPPPTSGSKVVKVLGYSVDNDGGGGVFFWAVGSSDSDNGGTIIQSTLSSSGRWKRIYSGALSVRWFGAVGDGSANDTDAIQAALNILSGTSASPSSGKSGVIYFPQGMYKITSELQFYGANGLTLIMHGDSGGDFGNNGGSGTSTLAWAGPAGGTLMHFFGLSGSLIRNMSFQGAPPGQAPNETNAAQYAVRLQSLQSHVPPGASSYGVKFYQCAFGSIYGSGATAGGNGGPACVALGEPTGGTYQVSSIYFYDCNFSGGAASSFGGSGILPLQNGNTKDFRVIGGSFTLLDYGVNCAGNQVVSVQGTEFTNIYKACVVLGGEQSLITNCEIETLGTTGKMFTGTVGNNPAQAILIGNLFSGEPTGNIAGDYAGLLILIGNRFDHGAGGINPVIIQVNNSVEAGLAAAGVNSQNNIFSNVTTLAGLFQDSNGNDLTIGSPGSYSQTNSLLVQSFGDRGWNNSTGTLTPLSPYRGFRTRMGGQATLTAGTTTVNTPYVASTSLIFLTRAAAAGTTGDLRIGTITAGTSFVINSASATDTSTVNWWIQS